MPHPSLVGVVPRKIKPPKSHLLVFLIVFVIIFVYLWQEIGVVVGILIAFLLSMVWSSILGVRYWKKCILKHDVLLLSNYTNDEALLEISKDAHPELSLDIHKKIVDKFNDINLLVMFYTGALPTKKADDDYALEVLSKTSIKHLGGEKYKVFTKK